MPGFSKSIKQLSKGFICKNVGSKKPKKKSVNQAGAGKLRKKRSPTLKIEKPSKGVLKKRKQRD